MEVNMSNKKVKLRSVVRIKKQPPRPELAHLDKRESKPRKKPTIKKVAVAPGPSSKANVPTVEKPVIGEVAPVVPTSASAPTVPVVPIVADNTDGAKVAASACEVEGIVDSPAGDACGDTECQTETVDVIIQKKLKKLSLAELQRYAKQSAKGADNAIVEHAELSAALDEKLSEIKVTKTPKDASEDVRAEYNAKRAQLRKERDAFTRKKTISYENAVALERAADEYAAIVALLLDQPEIDYRKQPRLNEKNVGLTDDEKLALIERFLASGRFSKQDVPVAASNVSVAAAPSAISRTPDALEKTEVTSMPQKPLRAMPMVAPAKTSEEQASSSDCGSGSLDGGRKRGRGGAFALLAVFGCLLLALVLFFLH